jgi:hypothetical protein
MPHLRSVHTGRPADITAKHRVSGDPLIHPELKHLKLLYEKRYLSQCNYAERLQGERLAATRRAATRAVSEAGAS